MSWTTAKLDELGTVGRGKSRHRPRNDPSLYGGDVPFLQTADITNANYYIESYSQTYNEKGLAQSKLWTEETLCMTIAGENTAKTAVLNFPACFPDSIVGFIPHRDKANLRFVKHALDLMKSKFRNVSKGATQDNLSLSKILSFDISVPPVEYQQKVAAILSAYDDLIENNRRRIGLLEDAARQLYKEWFVRFRFPGHEHVKILDGVPEGWEHATLGDALTLQRGFDLPTGDRAEGGVPVYGSTGIVGYHNVAKVGAPMIVTGRSGSLGQVCFVSVPCWPLNTALWVKELKRVSPWFAYFLLADIGLEKFNGGASVPTLDRKVAHAAKVIIPPQKWINSFDEVSQLNFTMIENLKSQTANLARARDLLLPRLMNGTLTV